MNGGCARLPRLFGPRMLCTSTVRGRHFSRRLPVCGICRPARMSSCGARRAGAFPALASYRKANRRAPGFLAINSPSFLSKIECCCAFPHFIIVLRQGGRRLLRICSFLMYSSDGKSRREYFATIYFLPFLEEHTRKPEVPHSRRSGFDNGCVCGV